MTQPHQSGLSIGNSHRVLAMMALLCVESARLLANDQSPCAADRPQDEMWIISTRRLPCGDDDAPIADKLVYRKFEQGRWQSSDREAFFAQTNPNIATVLFVHGDRIDGAHEAWLASTGYHALARCAPADKPLRFVLWSWPASRIAHRQLDDVRTKAGRTPIYAHHLARFLNELEPTSTVTLLGYSFGARIITGALHLLGGGQIGHRALAGRDAVDRLPLRAVLMAAALDDHWLLPGHAHGLALSQVDQMLVVKNGCDFVLRHYHWLYCRRSKARALGSVGIAGISQLGADRAKVSQLDACCLVGKQHDWSRYFCATTIVERICSIAFGAESPTPVPSADSLKPNQTAEIEAGN